MKVESPFHSEFKLQGKSFNSKEELIAFSKGISVEIGDFLEKWFNQESFVEVRTSGSTGKPKTIQLQKAFMINSAKATGDYFDLPEETTALLCMSPNYIAGKMMLVRALTLGWHLDVVEPSSTPLKNVEKHYDFVAMVPLQLYLSFTEMPKIKKLIVGGGAVSEEMLLKIKHIKTEVFITYGMTETISHIAVKKLNNFKSVIPDEAKQPHYTILPNITISIDRRGCLVIDAPKVSKEKVITNDLIEIISENEFKWLGRFDHIINSGGIKLIPEQIEEKLSAIIKNRFFVAGKQDKILGEKLILIFEGIKNDDILKKVHQLSTLSKYEIPKEIYFLDKFIETQTGKVNRIKTLNGILKT
ncbi:MAG: AMP-binding protein [Lutibacter sp.]